MLVLSVLVLLWQLLLRRSRMGMGTHRSMSDRGRIRPKTGCVRRRGVCKTTTIGSAMDTLSNLIDTSSRFYEMAGGWGDVDGRTIERWAMCGMMGLSPGPRPHRAVSSCSCNTEDAETSPEDPASGGGGGAK